MLQFWKSVQVIEQKHKSNYNRLHFLEYEVNKLKNEDGYSCFYAFVLVLMPLPYVCSYVYSCVLM